MLYFWGDKQRALWYVMVFSGVVNYRQHLLFLKPLYGGQHKQISIFLRAVNLTGAKGKVLRIQQL